MPSAFDLSAQQQSRGLRKAIALPFAQLWHGLNRAVSPQDLDGSESPDTTDACSYQDKIGALGPRPGRVRVTSSPYKILGMGALVLPTGRIRVYATDAGLWQSVPAPYQAPIAQTPPYPGFTPFENLTFNFTVAAGDTGYSNEVTLGSYDLSKYPKQIISFPFTGTINYAAGTYTETYALNLQGYIDGSWQSYNGTQTSGILTKLRMQCVVDGGSTDINSSIQMSVNLVSGVENQ